MSDKRTFESGAVRNTAKGKGRFDLISPTALMRTAKRYEMGTESYPERNWEKGIPFSSCVDSAMRHLVQWLDGDRSEDHLAGVVFNIFAIMHFERHKPEMNNIFQEQEDTNG